MMKAVFAVLAVTLLADAAMGARPSGTEYFQVTGDGSFSLYRNIGNAEYGNNGAGAVVRLGKSNQYMGWMSFYGAVGDGGGSMADFVNNNAGGDWSKVRAKLYFRTNGAGSTDSKLAVVSIRSGNVGGLVEDGNTAGVNLSNVGSGWTGSSQSVAFRACAPTINGTGFGIQGEGIYPWGDPTFSPPANGTPWITPAVRANDGRNGFYFGPGAGIQYELGGAGASGLYYGYNPSGVADSANYWALEDLLGIRQDDGMASGGVSQVYAAGQILAGGPASPTLFNPKDSAFDATDIRHDTTDPNWKSIALDPLFLEDLAGVVDPSQGLYGQNKGLAFTSRIGGLGVVDWLNTSFYTKEANGGAWAPYLELYSIPEPATLCLLTVGGLTTLRRRTA